MTALLVAIFILLFLGTVTYATVLLRSSLDQQQVTRPRQARVLREQYLAEQRLQSLTRSAMQQMLDAARESRRVDSG